MEFQILTVLITFLELYHWILFARIILSWFPAIDWYQQPFQAISAVTDPVLRPFRGLIPPLGGLDFSPILLFFGLSFLIQILHQVRMSMAPSF